MCPIKGAIVKDEKVATKVYSFEEAVALTGYGWYNVYLLLATGLCLMIVIMETMGMMFIIPAAQCDLNLTLTEKSMLSAISFLGVVSSSHLWGFIADTRGRKNVLVISMVMSFITTVVSSLTPNPWIFIILRYINGFFVGGSSAIVYAHVGEFHDNHYRPKVVSWIATFVAFGNMLLPALGWLILPLTFAYEIPILGIIFRPWRLLVIMYGFGGIIAAICIYLLPESPKYLLTEGKNEEALNILAKIYASNHGKNPSDFPVKGLYWEEQGAELHSKKKNGLLKTMWLQTVPLFQRNYLLKTFMVCLLQFGTFASSSGLLMWYPEILNKMASFVKLTGDEYVTVCEAINYFEVHEIRGVRNESLIDTVTMTCDDTVNDKVFLITIMIGAAFAVIYITVGSVINLMGNINLLLGSFLLYTIFGVASQHAEGVTLAQIFMGIFLLTATCIGVINTIVVDLYPTQMRGMALAISLMAGRFGAVTGSHLTGPLIYTFCDFTFYVFALDHTILILALFILMVIKRKTKRRLDTMAIIE